MSQGSEERRQLLRQVVSNSSWKHGQLAVQLHEPFDLILKEAGKARAADADDAAKSVVRPKFENWRRERDSNPRWLAPRLFSRQLPSTGLGHPSAAPTSLTSALAAAVTGVALLAGCAGGPVRTAEATPLPAPSHRVGQFYNGPGDAPLIAQDLTFGGPLNVHVTRAQAVCPRQPANASVSLVLEMAVIGPETVYLLVVQVYDLHGPGTVPVGRQATVVLIPQVADAGPLATGRPAGSVTVNGDQLSGSIEVTGVPVWPSGRPETITGRWQCVTNTG
jgi:hypothetical protein